MIYLKKKTTFENVLEFVKAVLKCLDMVFDKSIDRV